MIGFDGTVAVVWQAWRTPARKGDKYTQRAHKLSLPSYMFSKLNSAQPPRAAVCISRIPDISWLHNS